MTTLFFFIAGLVGGFAGGWYCKGRFGAQAAAVADVISKKGDHAR